MTEAMGEGDAGAPRHRPNHLVSILRCVATRGRRTSQVDHVFLDDAGREARVKLGKIWAQSGGIARDLRRWGARKGDRVLLVYPPGLDFVAALIACFRLGVTAVPAYPPNPKNLAQQAGVLGSIARDAGASIALTDSSYIWVARYAATYMAGSSFSKTAKQWMNPSKWWGGGSGSFGEQDFPNQRSGGEDGLGAWPAWLRWYSTTEVKDCDTFRDEQVMGSDVAFLQYTSGSTSAPKGVMITYSALSHNIHSMVRISNHNTVLFDKLNEKGIEHIISLPSGESVDDWIDDVPGVIVSWLPQYHDMGLIGHLLTPLFIPGMMSVRMSPFTFLKNPLAWAQAITKYQATVITAPDFGYSQLVKYALAAGKDGTFQVASYDFSHLRLALNGAGMIKYKTMRDFYFLFRHAGLPSNVFGGGFGLAEHCVYVSHGGETVLFVDRNALSHGQVIIKSSWATESDVSGKTDDDDDTNVSLVSCGRVNNGSDIDVSIVDPSTCVRVGSGCIGEIWISSPSKTGGYWKKEQETKHTFHALINGENNAKEYLRTGDLGFIWQHELFFVSRMKDLIVVHGRNIIPDDVELVISQSHKLIRTGCVAAFQTEEDVMCAVAEVRSADLDAAQISEITADVMSSMRKHNMGLQSLQLLKPRTIPKTTSGKVRRSECRQRFVEDKLDVVSESMISGGAGRRKSQLSVDDLLGLGFEDARREVLDYLLTTVHEMGLHVKPRDNLMDSGLDSSLMVGLHKTLEDVFGSDLSPSLLLDHATLDSIAHHITKDIVKSNDSNLVQPIHKKSSSAAFIDVEYENGHRSEPSPSDPTVFNKWTTETSRIADLSTLCMILYFLAMAFFAFDEGRLVDGVPLSLWKQEPAYFFEREFLLQGREMRLKDGFFGRKIDPFHSHFLSWIFDALPLYIFSGLLLIVLRRVKWITRRWSPAAITVGVSLFQILCFHGLSSLWSFASAYANFLVCKYAIAMSRKHPTSRCRRLIWISNILFMVLNKCIEFHLFFKHEDFLLGWPQWLAHGCREDTTKYSPYSCYKYLLLRQLSYSLDTLEEVTQRRKRGTSHPKAEVQSAMEYWAYMLYAPLYMHGPCMQFRHFRASPASGSRVSQASVHGLDKTEKPSQPFVLSQVAQRVSLTLGRLSVGLKDLIGMLAIIAAICFAMQTFYMPTIFFLKIHNPLMDVRPMNLGGPEHFVYGQMFLMFIFLHSHVVFGSCRALALMDGVLAPNDTPVSHLRSSLSVRQHWNNFHVSWRDFFLRYIYSFSNGGLQGLVLVIAFSSFIHGFYAQWYIWGALNFLAISCEQIVHSKKRVSGLWTQVVMSAVNQTLAFVLQLLIFVPFSVVSQPIETGPLEGPQSQFGLSLKGLSLFVMFNLAFSVCNSARIIAPTALNGGSGPSSFFW